MKFDKRRMSLASSLSSGSGGTQDLLHHLNEIEYVSLSKTETVIKLFLKTTAKVVLLFPFLLNSVGIVNFMILIGLVGLLGWFKIETLVRAANEDIHKQTGRVLQLLTALPQCFSILGVLHIQLCGMHVLHDRVQLHHRTGRPL